MHADRQQCSGFSKLVPRPPSPAVFQAWLPRMLAAGDAERTAQLKIELGDSRYQST